MAFFQSLRWPMSVPPMTALELAGDLHGVDADGGLLEEDLHRVLDFLLGRAGRDLEDVLVVLFGQGGALFGHAHRFDDEKWIAHRIIFRETGTSTG